MSKKHECTQKLFLRDVNSHNIKIVSDNDTHRHIIFKNPESSNYWFELITWPGTLCINGDCGTYVFSRIRDMFGFFKMEDNDFNKRKDVMLNINPSYWGEKLQSVDRCSEFTEFDSDGFRERVREHYDSFIESNDDIDDEHKNELWAEIEDEVLFHSDNEHEAYRAVQDFSHKIGDCTFEFTDFLDGGGTETYTWRYMWCLYAIVWGIQQYDLTKGKVAA